MTPDISDRADMALGPDGPRNEVCAALLGERTETGPIRRTDELSQNSVLAGKYVDPLVLKE